MTAAMACGVCGAGPREGARFCDACGSLITPAAEHAEYNQVTVLFAGVVHSMEIAATVGAERLREIMAELVNRAAVVVQRYGGTVDKFTGDGIMAVFGAPVALEDHAFRACLAALGMQEEAKRLAVVLPDYEPLELEIYVVYPTREHLPARTRRLLEFLKRWAKTPPDWANPTSQKRASQTGLTRLLSTEKTEMT